MFLFSHAHVYDLRKGKLVYKTFCWREAKNGEKNWFLKNSTKLVRKQHLGCVLKITVVHQHARTSTNARSFTNSFTYNFHLISIIIFSSKQSGHLFQNWPSTRAAHSRAPLIEGITYSTIEKKYNYVFKSERKTNKN